MKKLLKKVTPLLLLLTLVLGMSNSAYAGIEDVTSDGYTNSKPETETLSAYAEVIELPIYVTELDDATDEAAKEAPQAMINNNEGYDKEGMALQKGISSTEKNSIKRIEHVREKKFSDDIQSLNLSDKEKEKFLLDQVYGTIKFEREQY